MIKILFRVVDDLYSDVLPPSAAEIPSEFGPALRSALEDISNQIGERLVGVHKFEREDALTAAATALGPLRAAINGVIPAGDPNYE